MVMKTFDRKKVDALNTDKYEAVPILEHLVGLNRQIRESGGASRPRRPPLPNPHPPPFPRAAFVFKPTSCAPRATASG